MSEESKPKYTFCKDCGEYLGEYRVNYAQEHSKKYPTHKRHVITTDRNHKVVIPDSGANQ